MRNDDVKMIRLFEGETQRTFADKYGLAESTVAKIERDHVGVSDVTRSKIIRKFDMSDPQYIAFVKAMKATETDGNEVKAE